MYNTKIKTQIINYYSNPTKEIFGFSRNPLSLHSEIFGTTKWQI